MGGLPLRSLDAARASVDGMELEWDAAKDAENRRKHGLPLAAAARLEWGASPIEPDLRRDYGELRWRLTGLLDGRLHVCVYTFAKRPTAHHLVEKGQSS
jgi:uncharacterized DUF497 family protein